MSSTEPVTVRRHAGVATITMDDPDRKNVLGARLLNGLGHAIADAAASPQVRVIVLTNTGTTFCAGADLQPDPSAPAAEYDLVDVLLALIECGRPVVGAIAGHCVGGGIGLAAACDISLMTATSFLAFNEVRIGVAPAIISVVCRPKLATADALELFLTGRRIDAAEAARVRLVNRAVSHDELGPEVARLCADLIAGGPRALELAKRLVTDVGAAERRTEFARLKRLSEETFASAEAAAGIAAFRARRRPPWAAGDDRTP